MLKSWQRKTQLLLWITLTILSTSLQAEKSEQEPDMSHLVVEKLDIRPIVQNTMVTLTFSNQQDTPYFLEKRFVFQQQDKGISGFQVLKKGEKTNYLGIAEKKRPAKFPDDYIKIEPGGHKVASAYLNHYFELASGEKYTISYQILNANPKTSDLDEITFKPLTITIGVQ